MSGIKAALVWCPFPDSETAREVANQLLREKLIACANILPQVESVFEWQGECSSSTEAAVLFKTNSETLEVLVSRLAECHPYEAPAIVGWKCDSSHPLTLNWLTETLAQR